MFRLPQSDHRTVIVGHTGSGKTQFALWLLSNANFDEKPWLIIDYKGMDFKDLPITAELPPGAMIPKRAGIYITHPVPDDDDKMDQMLYGVWKRGNCGILVDESHMLPNGKAVRSCLTQGRSKQIPMIMLVQRPVFVSRFIFSEAEFYCTFYLHNIDDRLILAGCFPPEAIGALEKLPRYNSIWYDMADRHTYMLRPVPERDTIVKSIANRMPQGFWADLPRGT